MTSRILAEHPPPGPCGVDQDPPAAEIVAFPAPSAKKPPTSLLAKHQLFDLIMDHRPKAPHAALRVAWELLRRFNWERGNCFPSLNGLGARIGLGRTQVHEGVEWLLAHGFFTREMRGGSRTPLYWPNWTLVGAACPADALRSASPVRKTARPRDGGGTENRTSGVRETGPATCGKPHPIPDSGLKPDSPTPEPPRPIASAARPRPLPDPEEEEAFDESGPDGRSEPPDLEQPTAALLRELAIHAHCQADRWRGMVRAWLERWGELRVRMALSTLIAGPGTPEEKRSRLVEHVQKILDPPRKADCDEATWRVQLQIRADGLAARIALPDVPRERRPAFIHRALRGVADAYKAAGHPTPYFATLARARAVCEAHGRGETDPARLWSRLTAPAERS